MKIEKITLGADPEFLIQDDDTGEIVSAEGLIGGTKQEPKPISEVGHSVQEDNIMAEFNIPPAMDAKSFSRDINLVIDHINDVILPSNLSNSTKASHHMDEKFLGSEQSLMFGCEPDLNVWLRKLNQAPPSGGNLRTCGGHIHVGYVNPSEETSEDLIKAMDLFLGVPSIIMDTDRDRRTMYGNAGAFRFKPFGVEYRTLSNFWIFTAELKTWAFDNTIKATEFVNNGGVFSEELATRVQECINNQCVDSARAIVEEFNIAILEPAAVTKEYETTC